MIVLQIRHIYKLNLKRANFYRWSSFRDSIVRRNDSRNSAADIRLNSRQSSELRLNKLTDRRHSPKIISSPSTIDIKDDKSNSFKALATSQSIKSKDQFSGSTPVLFSKRPHTLGSASPTPHPRTRRARSEAERAGKMSSRYLKLD